MKEVIYKENLDRWSENRETNCWKIWTGQYWVCTSDRQLAEIIGSWDGIERKDGGDGCLYDLFLVPPSLIDQVIRVAKLPPRKKAEGESVTFR